MAGYYTEIVEIIAPSSAVAGETVNVSVKVKNIYSVTFLITVTGLVNDTVKQFGYENKYIAPGETKSFYDSFIMPNSNVKLWVWSWWYLSPDWILDAEAYKDIDVGIGDVFKGTISKKKLEYDGTYTTIPVSNVPLNKRGLVHIWGRNDTVSARRMGISWVVKDPDGIVVEEYLTWEAWPYTGAGKEHEFIGGRFDLNKVGDYTINVGLLMNPDDPTYVDIYYGDLCTVAIAAPTFSDLEINFNKTIKV